MATISGTVTSKSRNGTGIQINKGQWLNSPKNDPDMLAHVNWKDEVEAEVDGKDIKSIKVMPKAVAASGGSSGGDWSGRQDAIEWQSSRRDAISTVQAMVTLGVVPLPSAKEAKYQAFMDLIDTVALEYYRKELPNRKEEEV